MGFSSQEYWSGVAIPFSGGYSWPKGSTQVSHIAGGFFTIWATFIDKESGSESWSHLHKVL